MCVYGFRSLYSALFDDNKLSPSQVNPNSLFKITTITLALTWLNPHVYLDTVLLMGAISSQFQGSHLVFLTGAIVASWSFFFGLGFGAKYLQSFFNHPMCWKVLNFCMGIMMWGIAMKLFLS